MSKILLPHIKCFIQKENSMDSNYVDYKETFALSKFCILLENYIETHFENNQNYQSIVILCIGTDRCTGDSLGPLVGHKLKNLKISNIYVYGNLEFPVHAGNLVDTIEAIKLKYTSPFIIAIDACLGTYEHIGYICLKNGPLYPGAAMKKNLPPVGDLNITGIVNMCGLLDNIVLQSTRLSIVMPMAELIAKGVHFVLTKKLSLQNVL
jgi:putative sporulation protein YyaC